MCNLDAFFTRVASVLEVCGAQQLCLFFLCFKVKCTLAIL